MTLVFLAAAWLAGLVLGILADARPMALLLLFAAALPLGVLFRLNRWSLTPVGMIALLLLAWWRVEATEQPVPELTVQDSQSVTVAGWVGNDPEMVGTSVRFVLVVDTVDRGQGPTQMDSRVTTRVMVYAQPPDELAQRRRPPFFSYGDRLDISGQLMRPKPVEDFDYPAYLASRGISGVLGSREAAVDAGFEGRTLPRWRGWLFEFRHRLADNLNDSLSEPHSALALAILLGLRGDFPPDLMDDFRRTGTSHLLAISGLHVGVLLLLVLGFVGWACGRRSPVYVLLPLAAIWGYALVGGLPVSVTRAAIMGTILLVAWAMGRPSRILPALGLAAAAMAGLQPEVMTQVSFQLSFAAVAGIALAVPLQPGLAEVIARRVAGSGLGRYPWFASFLTALATTGLVSLAATLATWPLVAFYFRQIPLMGIPATMLALPALPVALVGAMFTALLGLIHPLAGQVAGWITWMPLAYLVKLVGWMPHWTVSGSWVGLPLLVGWYGLLAELTLIPGGLRRIARAAGWKPDPRPEANADLSGAAAGSPVGSLARIGLVLGGLAVGVGVLVWGEVLGGSDGKLHVHFLDVGQGDSALIVTPTGKQVVVDGGAGSSDAMRSLTGLIPRGDRSIDVVVMTHLDADHSRGLLEILERLSVGGIIYGVNHPGSGMYAQWSAALERSGVDAIPVGYGYRITLEPGLTLEVLNPQPEGQRFPGEDLNNNAVAFRMVYGEVSILMAADIEAEAEARMTRSGAILASNVLKVAHHGSQTSSTMGFLTAVDPDVAVISVGAGNQYGHPAQGVLARLEEFVGGENIFRTDRDGSIELITDGKELWVRTD